jgi:hypothetical protein
MEIEVLLEEGQAVLGRFEEVSLILRNHLPEARSVFDGAEKQKQVWETNVVNWKMASFGSEEWSVNKAEICALQAKITFAFMRLQETYRIEVLGGSPRAPIPAVVEPNLTVFMMSVEKRLQYFRSKTC